MKEIVKSMLILTVIYLLLFFLVNTNRQSQVIQEKQLQPVVITDTITNVVYDTVFINHFETVKLPVVDTLTIINDSLRIDSVFVEVPISVYKLDTVFQTDTTRLDLFVQNSGYDVTLDTLSYKFTYQPTPPVIKKKRHRFGIFVGPAVGLGYDWTTGKTLPSVGVGIGVGWSLGKY